MTDPIRKFAWFPIRAWYHQKVQWIWLKWYYPDAIGYIGVTAAICEDEK